MNQFTAVYNSNGELINNIKYYEGFMGQRVGAISCLAFHPHWVCALLLGLGDYPGLSSLAAGLGGPPGKEGHTWGDLDVGHSPVSFGLA